MSFIFVIWKFIYKIFQPYLPSPKVVFLYNSKDGKKEIFVLGSLGLITNYHRLVDLNNKYLLFTALEARVQDQVPAGSGFGEGSIVSCKNPTYIFIWRKRAG